MNMYCLPQNKQTYTMGLVQLPQYMCFEMSFRIYFITFHNHNFLHMHDHIHENAIQFLYKYKANTKFCNSKYVF